MLIFTEALIHGASAWQADDERRVLLYKYSPPHSRWILRGYDLSNDPPATAQQRRLLAPPSVQAYAPVVLPDTA